MAAAVEMRPKLNTLLGNTCQSLQAEGLKTAAVGEDRTLPAHEGMESAPVPDDLMARSQIEMIRVGHDDLGSNVPKVLRRQCLDRGLGPDGHEGGRLDRSVISAHSRGSAAAAGVLVLDVERKNQVR